MNTLPAWEADLLLEGIQQEMDDSPAESGLPVVLDEVR